MPTAENTPLSGGARSDVTAQGDASRLIHTGVQYEGAHDHMHARTGCDGGGEERVQTNSAESITVNARLPYINRSVFTSSAGENSSVE